MKTKHTVTEPKLSGKNGVSLGYTLLNLQVSNRPHSGLRPGGVYLIWGDSSAGKTWISYTCLAELALNTKWDNYKVIVDDVEEGALMDIERYFGKSLAKRLQSANRYEDGSPKPSETVEDAYDTLSRLCDEAEAPDGQPFIYVADSESAMTSVYAIKKAEEGRKARQKNKDAAGSYGDGKAKVHSENLRTIKSRIRKTGSIVIWLCQSRDNIGFGAQFTPKTRPGGHALKFYAHLEMQLALGKKIKKDVRGKKRVIGIESLVSVKKNRFTGQLGTITVPIYYSTGIDETGGCVKYLLDEKHWKKVKGKIFAKEFNVTLSEEDLIAHIENEGLNKDLSMIVKKVWDEVSSEALVVRKPRYS